MKKEKKYFDLEFKLNEDDCVFEVEDDFDSWLNESGEFDYDVVIEDCCGLVFEEDEEKLKSLVNKYNEMF
jgi:hypothetical protein